MWICSKYMCYLFYSLLHGQTGLSQDLFTNRSRMLQGKVLLARRALSKKGVLDLPKALVRLLGTKKLLVELIIW